jgi:prolipoprotein diacylglyceryltransferase
VEPFLSLDVQWYGFAGALGVYAGLLAWRIDHCLCDGQGERREFRSFALIADSVVAVAGATMVAALVRLRRSRGSSTKAKLVVGDDPSR